MAKARVVYSSGAWGVLVETTDDPGELRVSCANGDEAFLRVREAHELARSLLAWAVPLHDDTLVIPKGGNP